MANNIVSEEEKQFHNLQLAETNLEQKKQNRTELLIF